jgi:pyrimidine deaminase RibD-like protein
MESREPVQGHGTAEADRWHAERAIEEARHSPGNTRVGAVIALGKNVLATGFKGERESLHAEQVALEKAREQGISVSGAALYTTLEPCANSRTSRVPCCQLISDAGISVVHIGGYDPNPRVYRLGWKHLRDHGILLRDFPADLRALAHEVSADFTTVFTRGTGMSAGAKFDFTQNGGRFTISVDESADSPSWETRWSNCGATAIYLNGHRGIVAHARYAKEFPEIDDPDALDYGSHFAKLDIGSIGVMKNDYGHVLCKIVAIEPTVDYGGTGHTSATIKWEIRLNN